MHRHLARPARRPHRRCRCASHRQAMVGHRAGDRIAALHHVEPTHLAAAASRPSAKSRAWRTAAGCEPKRSASRQTITFALSRESKIDQRPRLHALPCDRLVLVPLGLGKLLQQLARASAPASANCWPRKGLRSPSPPFLRSSPKCSLANAANSSHVRTCLPAVDPLDDVLAAVGIVKLQDGRLGEGVGRPETRRMLRIALDLDRPAVDAGDQQPRAAPPMSMAVANRSTCRACGRAAAWRRGESPASPSGSPPPPASASEAPINCSQRRRLRPCGSSAAGNSASRQARYSGCDSWLVQQCLPALLDRPAWHPMFPVVVLPMTCRAIRGGIDVVFLQQAEPPAPPGPRWASSPCR